MAERHEHQLRYTRRAWFSRAAAAGIAAAAARCLSAGGPQAAPALAAAPALRRGGTLRIAEIGEPLTLDAPATTATVTAVDTIGMFEGLFEFDASWRPRPGLASGYTVSKDGLTYTLPLRSGVPFHNGKTMTADDVVASLVRWGKVSPYGAVPFRAVDTLTADGPNTVVIKLKTPFAPLIAFLALPASGAIMPKELINGVPGGSLKQYVGTGPYKFVEWTPDRYVHVTRFDQYAARDDAPSLYAGRKTAQADDVYYYPVRQVATRIAGVQSGDYDIADGINQDAYAQLATDTRVSTALRPGYYLAFFTNKKQGVMANQKMRQAIEVALDMQPIMHATFGDPRLYVVDASLYPKGTPWYSTAGASWYNAHNLDLAKQLAREAGYSGQPIRWLTNQQYDYMFKSSVVAVSQLQHAGFNVDMQVIEWASVLDRRAKPDQWDIFVTSGAFVPDPALLTVFSSAYPGWWDTAEKNDLFARFSAEPSQAKRLQMWGQLQTMLYREVGFIRPGDFYDVVITRRGLPGFKPAFVIIPWNVQAAR